MTTNLPFSLGLMGEVIKETWRGKTLSRIFTNFLLKNEVVSGQVIDLGSGGKEHSYWRYLKKNEPVTVTLTDGFRTGPNIVKLNLEEVFPLSGASYDLALYFNALELVYKHQHSINETARVLKPGGVLLGSVPFLVNVHPDPVDYFRYTDEALKRIIQEAGLEMVSLVSVGFGPLTVAAAYGIVVFPRFVRPFICVPLVLLDLVFCKLFPSQQGRYALAFLWKARKPEL